MAGAATGVVLSLQTRDSLLHFGAKALLPSIIVFSVIRESGPVITGLIVSGRVGAGIGAELGSMRVTEQIDAMEASAVDPFKYRWWRRGFWPVLLMLPSADGVCGFLRAALGLAGGYAGGTGHAAPFSRQRFQRARSSAISFRRR